MALSLGAEVVMLRLLQPVRIKKCASLKFLLKVCIAGSLNLASTACLDRHDPSLILICPAPALKYLASFFSVLVLVDFV